MLEIGVMDALSQHIKQFIIEFYQEFAAVSLHVKS